MMDVVRAVIFFFVVLAAVTATPPGPQILPPWPATWNMSRSTAFMPCDTDGVGPVPFDPQSAAKWGIADFDWSNGRNYWSIQKPMNCEETLLSQAEATHAANSETHVMVYRNSIKALPWFTSVREKLEDPAYWGFFLPFANCTHYECGPNATLNLYHDFEQSERDGDCGLGVECGEYLFELRNKSARAWLSGEYLTSETGLKSPAVNGFYFDDQWKLSGPTEVDPKSVAAMGLTPADVADLVAASVLSREEMFNTTVAAGGYVFNHLYSPTPNNASDAAAACAPKLRALCQTNAHPQTQTYLMQFTAARGRAGWPIPYPLQDLAIFLLSRGDYSWIGYSWWGCNSPQNFTRPSFLDVDYGIPTGGICKETGNDTGVFVRNYTKADVTMDCKTFTPTITMK